MRAIQDRFTDEELPILTEALSSYATPPGGRRLATASPPQSPLVRAAIGAAVSEHTRAATQAEQEQRLRDAFPGRVLTLPFVFAPAIEVEQLEFLAAILDRELG